MERQSEVFPGFAMSLLEGLPTTGLLSRMSERTVLQAVYCLHYVLCRNPSRPLVRQRLHGP